MSYLHLCIHLQLRSCLSERKIFGTEVAENKFGNVRRRNIPAALALLLFPDFKFVSTRIFEGKKRCNHFKCSFPRFYQRFASTLSFLRILATDLQSIIIDMSEKGELSRKLDLSRLLYYIVKYATGRGPQFACRTELPQLRP
jgi:hypothetical protein